ncbi:MAG: PAAR domain-containing protein [Burkholderiaceae bacterium]|nr:PAAR domain-containing protein [Burkholderiaceae bacterium]
MPPPVRLGDSTSHGGSVTSAASQSIAMGKPLALVGDSCSCPIPGHSNCTIVEGDPNWTIDGKAVALHGHKVSCGATLIASIGNVAKG